MAIWGPLLGGLATGALGAYGASQQAAGAERAGQPQPFSSDTSREPWGPTLGPLEEALGISRDVFEHQRGYGPPPRVSTSGIQGASPNLRELADAMRQRAMTSTFVPDAQAGLMQFLQGPNPMMQQVFDRSQSYSNPLLEQISGRSFGGDYSNSGPQLQEFLSALLGGQRQLGSTPNMPPQMAQGSF